MNFPCPRPCHPEHARRYPTCRGDVAEWLRSGLQSRLHRFDSGRRLGGLAGETGLVTNRTCPRCVPRFAHRAEALYAYARSPDAPIPGLTGSWPSRGRTALCSSPGACRSSSSNADRRREREAERPQAFPEMPHMQDIPQTGVTLKSPGGSTDVRVWYARGGDRPGCFGRVDRHSLRVELAPAGWRAMAPVSVAGGRRVTSRSLGRIGSASGGGKASRMLRTEGAPADVPPER